MEDTLGYTADPKNALYSRGKKIRTVVAQISITSSAAAGDKHILARGLSVDDQVVGLRLPRGCAQIVGLTDVDFGFYRTDNNVVLDADILADGVDFGTAAITDYGRDLLGENLTYDLTEKIKDQLDIDTNEAPSGGVDLVATVNAEGAGTGTITVYVDIADPA